MLEINGTIIVFALSFIIFIFLLDKVLWQPIRGVKEARSSDLSLEVDNALRAENKTKAIIEQVNSEIKAMKDSEHSAIEALMEESKFEEIKQEKILIEELEKLKRKSKEEISAESLSSEPFIESKSRELANLILHKIAPELREGAIV